MLPKKQRIQRKLFTTLAGGKLFHSAHFLLRRAPFEDKAVFGVSVSKKISKKAVVRNAIRRRAYAALAPLVSSAVPGVYLFSAKSGADKQVGAALKAELAELLSLGVKKG